MEENERMREGEQDIKERESLERRSKVKEETLRRNFKPLSFSYLLCFVI